MALIYQKTSSYSASALWNDPNVWDGGVVPTPADKVFMYGTTHTFQNSDYYGPAPTDFYRYAYFPWTGSLPYIKLSNTASLRDTGSLFAYTDRGLIVKINYSGTYKNSASDLGVLSASIDTSFNSWSLDIYPLTESFPSQKGGVIRPGIRVVQPPTPLIITGSIVPAVTCSDEWFIGRGASLTLKDPNFGLNGNIYVQDADLIITGSGTIDFKRHWTSSTGPATSASFIQMQNFAFQNLIIHGAEVRLNTQIQNPPQIGDGFISVVNTNGFAVDDYIFVGKDPDFVSASRIDDDQVGAAIYQSTMSSQDEAFRVAGISAPSTIYVQRYTGLDAKIHSTSSDTIIFVDEEKYQVGDKVVINNQVRTIVSASIEDILVKDYDFSGSGANLSEWETDVTRSLYFDNWVTQSGTGLVQFNSADYCHIFIKDLFLDKFKVEAWVSNLDQVTTGNTTPGTYGVLVQSPPQADQYSSFSPRTAFEIAPNLGRVSLYGQQNQQSSTYNNLYNYTSSLPLNGLKKVTIESSKGFLKGALEDKPIFEYYIGNTSLGSQWGRVGLFTNTGMTTFVCTRYRVHQKLQKLTLDQATTLNIGHKVYGTGVEFPHDVGERVIKLASMITTGSVFQDNLLYAYRGHSDYAGDGIYPMINGYNRTEAYTASKGSNLDVYGYTTANVNTRYGRDSYTDLGTGLNKSVILDLGTERTFNNIAWNDWTDINFATAGRPINISGSNNGVTWSVISGSFFDNRPNPISIDNLRDFTFPSQSFRYIRIETNGDSSNNNRFNQWYVRYLTGSNRIYVNNTYDYPIGSEIGIVHNNTLSTKYTSPVSTATQLNYLINGTSSWVGDLTDHYVVTNTGSNYLDLNRPYNETILPQNDALIVRLDRELKFSGSWDINSWRTGRISMVSTTPIPKRQSFRNVSFQHMNMRYPFINSADYGPLSLRATSDFFNTYNDMTGCTVYNSFDADQGAVSNAGIGFIIRHNFITGFRVPMQSGTTTYITLRKPWLWSGNIYHNIYSYYGGFEQNFAPAFYNYNIHSSFNTVALPSPLYGSILSTNPFLTADNAAISQKLEMIRNIGRKSQNGIFIGPGPDLQSVENVTLRENILDYPYATWRIAHSTQFYGLMQAMDTPFLTIGKRGFGFNRSNITSNAYNSGTNQFPNAGHSPTNTIKNYERLGYNALTQGYTNWIQESETSGYKLYNMGQYSNDAAITGTPWSYNFPVVAMNFELQDTSASVDISFDYQIPATELTNNVLYPGQLGGTDSLAGEYLRADVARVVVYKNGIPIFTDPIFASTTNLRNFTKSYTMGGPGIFRILLTQGLLTNYIMYNNFSSRIFTSDVSKMTMFKNGFDSKAFKPIINQISRLDFVQTPQTPIFRLRGSRIR
jgi:hypothetical protein